MRRLVEVGVAALGFGTEVVRVTPEPLVAACDRLGLPLLEVPYRTPFIAVTRRIADVQAEQEHARDLWALDAQRALSLAALSAERIAGVLEELSRRLAADVLLARRARRGAVRARPARVSASRRPRRCRPRRGGCCTVDCGQDRRWT